MGAIWIISVLLQWLVLAGVCLLTLSLIRQIGVLTLRINGMGASAAGEGPTVYTNIPRHTIPLMEGGTFILGGEQTKPSLVTFYTPGCGPCAGMSEEIRNIRKLYTDEELAMLVVLVAKRSEAESYMNPASEDGGEGNRPLEGISVTVREDFPEQYVPMVSGPYSFIVTADGAVAGRGRPRTLGAFRTMIYGARNMADSGAPGSLRIHDWGESAPYWELDGGPDADKRQAVPAEAEAEAIKE